MTRLLALAALLAALAIPASAQIGLPAGIAQLMPTTSSPPPSCRAVGIEAGGQIGIQAGGQLGLSC